MKKFTGACAAALIFSISGSGSIYAQDWAGPYAGASFGYSKAKDSGIGYDEGSSTPNGWTHTVNLNGASLGIFGGYNWVFNNKVLIGLEAEYLHRADHSDRDFQYDDGALDTLYSARTQIEGVASIRARIGRLFNQQKTLAYASLGRTNAKVKRTWIDDDSPETESHRGWQNGWTAGIGLEHKYNKNLSVRAEVRRSDYGTKVTSAADIWSEYYKDDLAENSVMLGLGYKF